MVELRKSTPQEVDLAVPLIYASGPDAFEYVFKNDKVGAQDFLKHAFVKEGGEFSYQNHYSLYQDRVMVGVGSIFDAKEASTFMASDIKRILEFYKFNSLGIGRRGLQVEKIIKHPIREEVALAHLSITPDFRGKGFGTKLIDLLKEKSEIKHFVLDVSEENPRAKDLYKRLGFVVTKDYKSNLKNKYSYVPDHCRMELIS